MVINILAVYPCDYVANWKPQNNAQQKSCEFQFLFWFNLLRTVDWEVNSQIALRNCSAETGEELVHIDEFLARKYIQSSTHLSKGLLLVKRTDISN